MWPFSKEQNVFDEALKKYVDKDFSVFAAGEDRPAEKDIAGFEQFIGFRLPEDFRKYSCSKLGGLYVEAKQTVWPRPAKNEVAPFWSFLYGFFAYGFSPKVPETMNIRLQTEKFRSESKTAFVPCLKVLMDPDVYCFDEKATLRRWDHETGEAALQNKSFSELFVEQAAALRERKDRRVGELKGKPTH